MADETSDRSKPAKKPLATKAPSSGRTLPAAGWQATEDDWAYLKATKSIRAWKLAAFACGIHPLPRIGDQLPPKIKAQYSLLRKAVRGSLTSTADGGGLLCNPEGVNAGSSADAMPVQLGDFVAFMDAAGLEIHPRMRQIAVGAVIPTTHSSDSASNPALERSIELSRIRIDERMRPEDITRRLKSVSRLLLAIAVQNDRYKYDVSKLDRDGKTIVGEPSRVFAALSEAVAASGLGTMDGETVREALWFAIDMCGRGKVMEALLPKKA